MHSNQQHEPVCTGFGIAHSSEQNVTFIKQMNSITSLYFQALSAAIALGFKIESSTVKDILRMVANVEFKTPYSPVYEVKLLSSAEIPRVNILLNKVIDDHVYQFR